MPKYTYCCKSCDETFEQYHSMKTVLEDCHLCGSPDSLVKIPSIIRVVGNGNNIDSARKPGSIVQQHIEEARKEIKQEKEMFSQDYEP